MTRHFRQRTNASPTVLRASAVVLLAHVGLIWLLIDRLASPTLPGSSEQVILASVVSEMPAPVPTPAQAAPVRPALQPMGPTTVKAAPSAPSVSTDTPSVAATATSRTTANNASAHPDPTAVATLVLPSSDADYLRNPPPAYPRMSRRMGEQGTVLVRVFINAEGRAEKTEIRSSSGYARLDEAALEAVQHWRYVPGQRAGQPQAMWFNVPIRFMLD